MNKVYFVRHAKPDFSVHDDLTRPLTDEGRKSSEKLINFFKDKNITKIYSSPYKRSIDTVRGIALSTIINYFIKEFDYIAFERIKDIMPWVVCIEFEGDTLVKIEEYGSF